MSEMIVRVAARIERELDVVEMVSASPEVIRHLRAMRVARIAIEEMRNPTIAMVAEGESAATFGIGKPADDVAVLRVWQWMIDEALKP
ncbi:hypothetical protein J1C56_01980 [Aminobacter anthyllidis]|uniref:Uncharacterized protein n=1 Tax=Aminobacter anthyllidis TaxID=1035067 RepID=A0A9X1D478_9HYPH|nr:hypothetical protein [Aminobacter anthyllidis]MBT1154353.1 hypothetical protein [Aminobacter anthyllidis]